MYRKIHMRGPMKMFLEISYRRLFSLFYICNFPPFCVFIYCRDCVTVYAFGVLFCKSQISVSFPPAPPPHPFSLSQNLFKSGLKVSEIQLGLLPAL